MRRFAIVFATLFAVALLCVGPMLYGANSADKRRVTTDTQRSSTAEEKTVLARWMGRFADRTRVSQPLWMLVLGTALIVSANRLSRVSQARVRFPLPAPVGDDTRARGLAQDCSGPGLSFDSTLLGECTWLKHDLARRTLSRG